MRVDSISARVRLARDLVGLSARELDRLAGLAEGHSSIIEASAKKSLSTQTAQALARVLGLSLDWLIAGDGKPPSERAVRAAVDAARTAYAKSSAA